MISAEEIKALMAKEHLTTYYHKHGETKIPKQTNEQQAIQTLQTLLNQAAEVVQKVIGDYKGLAAACKANSLWRTHNDALETIAYLEKRLAAIEPYLSKETPE